MDVNPLVVIYLIIGVLATIFYVWAVNHKE